MLINVSGSRQGVSLVSNRLAQFWRCESGATITALVLIWLIMMLVVSGIAIDFARAEHLRARLQATTDRCALMASDIDQQVDTETLVLDCFDKAGLGDYVSASDITIDVAQAGNRVTSRAVSIRARGILKSSTLQLSGIDYIGTPTAAGAIEGTENIEIVLVLDVSGSMRGQKLADLQASAQEFVDLILGNESAEGRIGIAIVPYNGQVDAGAALLANYNVTGPLVTGECINWPTAAFSETSVDASVDILPRADFFDPWNTGRTSMHTYCQNNDYSEITLPTSDADHLKQRIAAFEARGNTSIEIGMKWGVTLIDPSFRPVMQDLINADEIEGTFAGQPFNYTAPNSSKYIVLMTDGRNTDEYRIQDPYRTGLSPVYYNSALNQISIHHPGEGSSGGDYWREYNQDNTSDDRYWASEPYDDSTQLTWEQVWQNWPVKWVAEQLYDDPLRWSNGSRRDQMVNDIMGGGSTYDRSRGQVLPDEKDDRAQAICDAFKFDGAGDERKSVQVYTIAFQAPTRGQDLMKYCASSEDSHYFDAQNSEDIRNAFRTIARQVTKLRLTQ